MCRLNSPSTYFSGLAKSLKVQHMRYDVSYVRSETRSDPREVLILKPRGQMSSLSAIQFGQVLQEICNGRYPCVLIEMHDVSLLDSCGVGVLVAGAKTARQHGVQLALVSLSSNVRLVAEFVQLAQIIDIYFSPEHFLERLT